MSKKIRALPSLLRLSLGPDAPLPYTTEKVPPSAPVEMPPPLASDPDPAEVARVLGLPLGRFAEAGSCLEVRVPWWPEPLWFVPGPEDVAALEAAGVSRGRVWTAAELLDLVAVPGLTKAGVPTVALAKLAVAGQVAEVRRPARASPGACFACRGADWWRSTAGRTICRACHPPAPGAEAGR